MSAFAKLHNTYSFLLWCPKLYLLVKKKVKFWQQKPTIELLMSIIPKTKRISYVHVPKLWHLFKLKEFLSKWNEEMANDSNKEVTVVELYNMQGQPTNISKSVSSDAPACQANIKQDTVHSDSHSDSMIRVNSDSETSSINMQATEKMIFAFHRSYFPYISYVFIFYWTLK